jgi:hypothetical protein
MNIDIVRNEQASIPGQMCDVLASIDIADGFDRDQALAWARVLVEQPHEIDEVVEGPDDSADFLVVGLEGFPPKPAEEMHRYTVTGEIRAVSEEAARRAVPTWATVTRKD